MASRGSNAVPNEVFLAEPAHCAHDRLPIHRVLVVDDNYDAGYSIQLLLQVSGYEVQFTQDGQTALDLAKVFRPDAVLLDIGLPGMDGYEVSRHLREDTELAGILIVALSGYPPGDSPYAGESDFDIYLVKPVDADRLIAALE